MTRIIVTTDGGRLALASQLWERFCKELAADPGKAKTRLIAGIQVAIRDAIEDGSTPSLDEGSAPVGWLPIASAPKDGRDILCWSDGLGMGALVLFWADGYWREKANRMGLKREPDYWMPIPTAPSSKASATADSLASS